MRSLFRGDDVMEGIWRTGLVLRDRFLADGFFAAPFFAAPFFAAKPPPHLAAGGSPRTDRPRTPSSREAAAATCTGNTAGQLPLGYETRGAFALPLALYNRLRGNRCLNLTGLQTVTNFDNHGRFPHWQIAHVDFHQSTSRPRRQPQFSAAGARDPAVLGRQ